MPFMLPVLGEGGEKLVGLSPNWEFIGVLHTHPSGGTGYLPSGIGTGDGDMQFLTGIALQGEPIALVATLDESTGGMSIAVVTKDNASLADVQIFVADSPGGVFRYWGTGRGAVEPTHPEVKAVPDASGLTVTPPPELSWPK